MIEDSEKAYFKVILPKMAISRGGNRQNLIIFRPLFAKNIFWATFWILQRISSTNSFSFFTRVDLGFSRMFFVDLGSRNPCLDPPKRSIQGGNSPTSDDFLAFQNPDEKGIIFSHRTGRHMKLADSQSNPMSGLWNRVTQQITHSNSGLWNRVKQQNAHLKSGLWNRVP